MNLKDIRDAIFSQADWAPTQSTDAKNRVDTFINRAYMQMAEEAPFLFFEQTIPFATMPDITADAAADTLSVETVDPYVLTRTPVATANGTAWRTDGYWNGRMLEITRSDGTRYRRRIRDIWKTADASPKHRISLYQPWPNRTDTGLTYRIYNQAYYLPQDVIQVNSVRLYDQNQNWPLKVVGQHEAEMLSLKDMPNRQVTGIPRTIFRDGHFQLETPTLIPTVAPKGGDDAGSNWAGPDAAGEFEYVYTYAWGYRDGDITNGSHVQNFNPRHSLIASQGAPAARPIPRWESAPSPAASGATTNGGRGLLITTPDLDFMEGFGQNPGGAGTTNIRYQHGGLRKRIYRKRKTLDTGTPGTFIHTGANYPGQFNQERPDAYFLLADIPGYQTTYLDQGLIVPDYRHRLQEIHGYQSIRMNPRPDRRYEVEVRCVRRPKLLSDDQDVPVIHKDGMNCLLQKSIALLYEAQGDINLADRALGKYQEALFTLTKRYGDLRYPATPLKRRPARASYVLDELQPFRRWYTLP